MLNLMGWDNKSAHTHTRSPTLSVESAALAAKVMTGYRLFSANCYLPTVQNSGKNVAASSNIETETVQHVLDM